MQQYEPKTMTIRGIVSPVAWDSLDRVCGVCVINNADEVFYIDDNPGGVDMIEYLKRSVCVTGLVTWRSGRRYIKVDNVLGLKEL